MPSHRWSLYFFMCMVTVRLYWVKSENVSLCLSTPQLSLFCTGAPETCRCGATSPSTWPSSWTCWSASSTPWRASTEVSHRSPVTSWHWQQACAAPPYSHECFLISPFTTAVNSRWPPAFTFYFLNMRRCLQENVLRQKSSCILNLCVSAEQKGDQGRLFLLLVTILITTCF